MVFLIFAQSAAMAFVFAIFFGIAYTWLSIPQPLIIGKFFGQKSFAAILGIGIAVMQLASSVTSPVVARVYDVMNSYTPAFVVLTVIMAAGVILTLVMFRIHETGQKSADEAKQSQGTVKSEKGQAHL